MSATVHTPGPWHVLGEHGCAFQIGDHVDASKASILATRFMWEGKEQEMAANGRLMAAAPELLEALQDLVEAGEEAWGSTRPCVAEAIRVIAKATGSAQ